MLTFNLSTFLLNEFSASLEDITQLYHGKPGCTRVSIFERDQIFRANFIPCPGLQSLNVGKATL